MARVVVTDYLDRADGLMSVDADGSGQFERVRLRPEVTITRASIASGHRSRRRRCGGNDEVPGPRQVEPDLRRRARDAQHDAVYGM